MKAIVYEMPVEWTYAEVPTPDPGPGEVRLRMVATGVCGTDLHLHVGEFGPVYPLTPGHEIVGVVEETGDGVDDRVVGELIALDNMMACGYCNQCRRARPQFCASMRALGVTDPGGFAEFVIAPAGKCHNVGDLSLDIAVLAEPTACVVHGLDVLQLRPGSDVLVFGSGPTGLILAQLLRQAGAGRVTVAARTQFKLELAAAQGADEVVLIRPTDALTTSLELRTLAPDGFDVVIDATGSVDILAACLPLLAIGGTLFVYGMTEESAQLAVSPYDIFRRELVIKGSFAQGFSFDRAVTLLKNGRLATDGIITHRFGLADYGKAIDAVANDPLCLKAIVVP
jgi:D-arabinitol dehydrogenase (NADP+)